MLVKFFNHINFKGIQQTTILWIVIAGFSICISASIQWLPSKIQFNAGDEWFRDHFVRMHASSKEEERIILVDIDEASISQLGTWPWKRAQIADLIEKLISVYEVNGVALDIFFSTPADKEGDQRLAALGEFAPVVFAQAFDFKKARPVAWEIGFPSSGTPFNMALSNQHSFAIATGHIANHVGLINNKHTGNIGFVPDEDGTLRHIPSNILYKNIVYSPLARALFDCCAKSGSKPFYGRLENTNKDGFSRVNFSKNLSAYTVLSASNIFQDSVPHAWLKNKLVIIGSSSLSLSDRVSTPLNASTSGFLVHAEILSDLLDAQGGKAPMTLPGGFISVLYTLFVVAGGIYMFRQYSAAMNTAMLGIASALWILIAYFLTQYDMWFSPTGPLIANFFLLAVAIPYAWHSAEHKSKHLLDTLNQYVAKSVVKELMRSDIKDPLQPRKLNVTTLIADMASYTTHIEKLSMEDAASLTKEFLECLTAPVLEMGGTLDKYTGDGLVAFWGAPLPTENHADRALDAAIKMLINVEQFNEIRRKQGKIEIMVRIGIESGLAMAGDFGSSYRSIYTAIGDSVNTASRLEDVCRHFPYNIIVGQGTVNYATKHAFKFIEERILKGKEIPTKLYTLELH